MFVQGYVYNVCKFVPVYLGKEVGAGGRKEGWPRGREGPLEQNPKGCVWKGRLRVL